MKNIFAILTLSLVCITNNSFAQISSQEEEQIPATFDTNPDNSPEAIAMQSCLAPGAVVVPCGCWGYVNLGEVLPAEFCCSGYARAFSCGGWCSGGGSRWYNRCTF